MAAPDISAQPHRVLICQGRLCRRKGASASKKEWMRESRALSATLLSTGCLRLCGMGPVAVIYPEGLWLQRMTPEHVREGVKALTADGDRRSVAVAYQLPRQDNRSERSDRSDPS